MSKILLTFTVYIVTFFVIESLLVVSAVGIQLTTTFASGRKVTMFYDMSNVKAVIINEAITMVISYFSCFGLSFHSVVLVLSST